MGTPGSETAESALGSATMKQGFLLLSLTSFFVSLAMSTSQTIQPNFFRDEIGLNGGLNGYLIAIRELPGFLLIFVAAILLRQGLARATSISLIIMGVGYIAFSPSHSFLTLVIPTIISSVGYHSWLQLQDALGLSLAERGKEGAVLGKLRSIGFAGSLVAMVTLLAVLVGVEHFVGDLRDHQGPYLRAFFVIAGLAGIIGAVTVWKFPVHADERAMARAAPRITWRKEYHLYYLLTFLDGSRMQIYFAFAPFVLVEQFNVNARSLTTMLIIAAVINWRTGSVIGRFVDRFGERTMLTIGYSLHLVVFLGFAFAPNVWIAYLCYTGYNWLFLFSIGTTTYLRKICRREDLAPSLAMGISLAHVTAIIVPIAGAALWTKLGYQFPFLFGTLFVVASIVATQFIGRRPMAPPSAPEPARPIVDAPSPSPLPAR